MDCLVVHTVAGELLSDGILYQFSLGFILPPAVLAYGADSRVQAPSNRGPCIRRLVISIGYSCLAYLLRQDIFQVVIERLLGRGVNLRRVIAAGFRLYDLLVAT